MKRQQKSPSGVDPEATTELPLDLGHAKSGDPLARTDTWAVLQVDAVQDRGVVPGAAPGAHLEGGLRSLSASLHQLTEELAAKSVHLADVEAQLTAAQDSGRAAIARAETAAGDLAAVRAQLAAAEAAHAQQLTAAEAAQAQQLAAAEATHAQQLHDLAAERDATLARLAAEHEQSSAQAAAQHAAALDALTARFQGGEAAVLRTRLQQLEAQCAAQLESLHTLEGRRGVFDVQLRALDDAVAGREHELAQVRAALEAQTGRADSLAAELAGRDQRIGLLEGELATAAASIAAAEAATRANAGLRSQAEALEARLAEHAERIRALEAELGARIREHEQAAAAQLAAQRELAETNSALRQRTDVLEQKLGEDRTEAAARRATLQHAEEELAARAARIAAAERQVSELQAEIGMHTEAVHTLQEELQSRVGRGRALEADLRAAEDSVNRLEGELRGRSARIDELTRANGELHAQVEAARKWLEERDSLMQRLESEAANSAVLVDTIQRNLRSLTPGVQDDSVAGNRLLIRTDDGHEVIHVLGRRTTIGRTPDNDVPIEADYISRHHALIVSNSAQTVLEDLNSTNGVQVNGRRITRQLLQDGDIVAIGKAKFRFVVRRP